MWANRAAPYRMPHEHWANHRPHALEPHARMPPLANRLPYPLPRTARAMAHGVWANHYGLTACPTARGACRMPHERMPSTARRMPSTACRAACAHRSSLAADGVWTHHNGLATRRMPRAHAMRRACNGLPALDRPRWACAHAARAHGRAGCPIMDSPRAAHAHGRACRAARAHWTRRWWACAHAPRGVRRAACVRGFIPSQPSAQCSY